MKLAHFKRRMTSLVVVMALTFWSTFSQSQTILQISKNFDLHIFKKDKNIYETKNKQTDAATLAIMAELAIAYHRPSLANQYYQQLAQVTKDPLIAKRAIQLALSINQPLTALKSAKIWANANPDDLEAQQIATNIFIFSGKIQQSLPYLELLLQSPAGNPYLARFINGLQLTKKSSRKQLSKHLLKIVGNQSLDNNALFNAAQLLMVLGKPQESLALTKQVLQQNSKWVLAITLQAQLLLEAEKLPAAIDYIKQQVKKHPEQDELKLVLADLLFLAQDFKQSEKLLTQVITNTKLHAQALINLANLKIHQQDFLQAKEYLLQVSTVEDYKDLAFYTLGEIDLYQQEYSTAIKWYTQIEEPPYYLPAQLKAVKLLAQTNQLELAREHLHQLTANSHAQATQIFLLEAEILLQAGKKHEALKTLNYALTVVPNDIELLYAHGLISQGLEHYQLLENDLKRILQIDPAQARVLNILGFFLTEQTQRYQEAKDYLQRALKLQPENPAILDSIGWLQYRLGNYQLAEDYLQRAYQKLPEADVARHLAIVLYEMGQAQQAIELLQKALQISPGNKILQETLTRLQQQMKDR